MMKLRLAELIAVLSLATDLGLGHPMERALRVCLLSVRLGERLGLSAHELSDTYYVALLRFAGCAADAMHRASVFGDEIALGPTMDAPELWKPWPMLNAIVKHAGEGLPLLPRAQMLARSLATGIARTEQAAIANCEVAESIANRLGLSEGVRRALLQVFERWDGRGVPGKAKGEELTLPSRITQLAQNVELYYRLGGVEAAVGVAQQRAGGQYDPQLVECFCQDAPHLLSACETASPWQAVLEAEPGARPYLLGEQIDDAVRAIADFNDLRLPWLTGHSTFVAQLADAAARQLKLPEADVTLVRRAALIHDVGMTSVSVSVWNKAGALSDAEWDRVRLHSYYTERIVARSPMLSPLGALAALHHERLDGTGYHRQLPASLVPPAARILAAAEAYQAMTEARPYREALSRERAAEALRHDAKSGKLDGEAVQAVLAAAGHKSSRTRRATPAGLSDRELEVLRLLAGGLSNKQMAQKLVLSPATIDHHIRHIYNKIGCSTRIAATMFAMQHQLIEASS